MEWLLARIADLFGSWALMIVIPLGVWLALLPYIEQMRETRDRKRSMPDD
jgi:hypothetical protein